jgi:small subunit ribosomal protein S4e
MKSHLKRIAVPKTWPIERKTYSFVSRPYPTIKLDMCLPIGYVLRDLLKLASNIKEAKHILNHNYIFVNGVHIKNHKSVLGFMDILSIKDKNEYYRLLFNKVGKLQLNKIDESESKIRPNRIISKSLLPKGKLQINFMNGYNIITSRTYLKVGDVLLLEMPSKKILDVLSLEKNSPVYLFAGNHVGKIGLVSDFDENEIVVKIGKDEIRTKKAYALVIGKDKPLIKIDVE